MTSLGNSVSPSAVTAPLMAVAITRASPEANASLRTGKKLAGPACPERQAEKAASPVKASVFVKCNAMTIARATESSSATSPPRTNPAPIAPSKMMNSSVRATAAVTCPGPKRFQDHSSIAKPKMPQSALLTRCENSISVSVEGAVGTTSP